MLVSPLSSVQHWLIVWSVRLRRPADIVGQREGWWKVPQPSSKLAERQDDWFCWRLTRFQLDQPRWRGEVYYNVCSTNFPIFWTCVAAQTITSPTIGLITRGPSIYSSISGHKTIWMMHRVSAARLLKKNVKWSWEVVSWWMVKSSLSWFPASLLRYLEFLEIVLKSSILEIKTSPDIVTVELAVNPHEVVASSSVM